MRASGDAVRTRHAARRRELRYRDGAGMKRAAWIALAAGSVLAQDRTISSDAEVRAVAFGRDGKVLTGLCGDGKLRLWDVRSGAMRKALAWSKDESTAAFPQEGDVFATTGAGGIIT